MKFGVLGPLLLTNGDKCCVPTAPKGRQLLALLMVNANQFVPVHACVDELWQSNPPKSAMSTLQTYVLQIRTLLRAAAKADDQDVLATRNRSYQLRVPLECFDRTVFDSTIRRARAATVRGDDQCAADLFDSALDLWRGPALIDVPDGPIIALHRIELEETRFGVVEERIETGLRLGRHRELLTELRTLVDTHPMHENVQAQLMIALYRSGRQAQAIEMFHRLRGLLRDKFGLDPVPRMQRLYEAILVADPMLLVPAPRPGSDPPRLAS
jgi:DNA-binding SARP family transcriptional activator